MENQATNIRTLNAFVKEAQAANEVGGYRLPPEVQRKRMERVIATKLTERQREYLGYCLAGESMQDVAKRLGVSPSTVCRTVHRAVRRARDYLQF